MDPFTPTQDQMWHRMLDGLVVITIGVVMGILVSQWFMSTIAASDDSRLIRETPTLQIPNETPGTVDAPGQSTIEINEI